MPHVLLWTSGKKENNYFYLFPTWQSNNKNQKRKKGKWLFYFHTFIENQASQQSSMFLPWNAFQSWKMWPRAREKERFKTMTHASFFLRQLFYYYRGISPSYWKLIYCNFMGKHCKLFICKWTIISTPKLKISVGHKSAFRVLTGNIILRLPSMTAFSLKV